MPAIYLTEDDVQKLVNMSDAVQVTERAFLHLAEQTAVNASRSRLRTDSVMLHVLAGSDQTENQLGWKIYSTTRQQARFLVGVYDGLSGELQAIVEADFLGQLRTGAASGVATKLLAKPNAARLGIIGTGLQARTQAWAMAEVRQLEQILVFSRNSSRCHDFAQKLSQELKLPVQAATSAIELVQQSDLLVTATTSKTPVFQGADLQAGTHINAIGSNFLKKSEVDLETFRRLDLICCDSIAQCKLEAGDFVEPLAQNLIHWDQIYELSTVVSQQITRSKSDQITLFKSVGLGLQDVALGSLVVERAKRHHMGIELPF